MCGACTFPLPQVALSLRLAAAKSLRRMGKLDEAETHFKVLAGGHVGVWVAQCNVAFCRLAPRAEQCHSAAYITN
jgi:hypothetical protein